MLLRPDPRRRLPHLRTMVQGPTLRRGTTCSACTIVSRLPHMRTCGRWRLPMRCTTAKDRVPSSLRKRARADMSAPRMSVRRRLPKRGSTRRQVAVHSTSCRRISNVELELPRIATFESLYQTGFHTTLRRSVRIYLVSIFAPYISSTLLQIICVKAGFFFLACSSFLSLLFFLFLSFSLFVSRSFFTLFLIVPQAKGGV